MAKFNILEQARLIRRLAVNSEKIKKLESFLKGQPLGTVRFADASITNVKISSLSADKITTGTVSVGEEIIISDDEFVRVYITHDEFRISKPGADAITGDIKDMVILNQEDAHKLFYKGFVTSGTYTHSLGAKPIFFCFATDSTSSPTYFSLTKSARANTSQIVNIPNPSYLVVFRERI
jgi:hypothetical protein